MCRKIDKVNQNVLPTLCLLFWQSVSLPQIQLGDFIGCLKTFTNVSNTTSIEPNISLRVLMATRYNRWFAKNKQQQ